MNYGRDILICLERIQDLALRAGPARCLQCTALTNALLVHGETDTSGRLTGLIADALRAWRNECGTDLAVAEFDREMEKLTQLLASAPGPRRDDEDNPPARRWSLGPNALAQLALLRADLGLSILFLYRHFADHLHFRLPYPDFLASLDQLAEHASQALRQAPGR